MKIRRRDDCAVCSDQATIHELGNYEQQCSLEEESAMSIEEMNVVELSEKIDSGEFVLIDVREDHELKIASLEQAKHIPLGDLPDRLGELDKDESYVIMCRSGKRSMSAAELMVDSGFSKVKNLVGGILDWAEKIDTSMEQY